MESGDWMSDCSKVEERIGDEKLEATTIDVSFKHFYSEVEQKEG